MPLFAPSVILKSTFRMKLRYLRAAVHALAAVAGMDVQRAVLDAPALIREGAVHPGTGALPAVGGLAVEQELPAVGDLLRGEGVRDAVHARGGRGRRILLHVLGGGRGRRILLHVLGDDAEVLPADLVAHLVRAHHMHLQGDEARGIHIVDEVRAGDAVHPGADVRTDALHAGVVPAILVGLPGRLVLRHPVQPQAAGLVIDAAGPGTRGRVDLELVAVDQAAVVVLVAPELDA